MRKRAAQRQIPFLPEKHRIYSTRFPLVGNPISEGGNGVHGETIGVDWADVRTTPGFAFANESRKVKIRPRCSRAPGDRARWRKPRFAP
jgi:hypothetical protein